MILVNFKTFEEGSGEKALHLVSIIDEVAKGTQIPIIPAVQVIDLESVVRVARSPVWVQNIDPITYGAHTGQTLAEEALHIGARGTLLNHSENKYEDREKLKYAIIHAQTIGLEVLVFASSIEELKLILKLKPNYASYEPPEFIGSTSTSVAKAKPEIIAKAAKLCQGALIPLIVGAGIRTQEDVATSVKLGATGVAVATNIVKATDPKAALLDLLGGF
jgi:triosephosphate isomerase